MVLKLFPRQQNKISGYAYTKHCHFCNSDDSITDAKDSMVSYLSLSRNFGKEIAMLAGLDYAEGDAVIIMDADLQDPPELIPQMIREWENGYDDVYARRRNRAGET